LCAAMIDWCVEKILRARLKEVVPVRGRPAPMTCMVLPDCGDDGCVPMVGEVR
jgi:hypothetical protein